MQKENRNSQSTTCLSKEIKTILEGYGLPAGEIDDKDKDETEIVKPTQTPELYGDEGQAWHF